MQVATVVIADNHLAYANGLTGYFREIKESKLFTVRQFTHLDHAVTYLKQTDESDVIIITSLDWVSEIKQHATSMQSNIIVLVEDKDTKLEDMLTFYRYQPLDQLVLRIQEIFHLPKVIPKGDEKQTRNTLVLAVFSTAGGSGKTITASNFAYHLTQQGHKVMYLSFEYWVSLDSPQSQGNGDFSKLMYMLKNHPDKLQKSLHEIITQHVQLKCDSLPVPAYTEEMLEMSAEETIVLLQTLTQMDRYDFIIVDLASTWDERMQSVLQNSDLIVWLLLDDIYCRYKSVNHLRQLYQMNRSFYQALLQKSHFVINKSLHQARNNNYSLHGIRVQSHLPYIPKWKTSTCTDEYLKEADFYRPLLQLISKKIERRQSS